MTGPETLLLQPERNVHERSQDGRRRTRMRRPWHALTAEEVEKRLGVDPAKGLDATEAANG